MAGACTVRGRGGGRPGRGGSRAPRAASGTAPRPPRRSGTPAPAAGSGRTLNEGVIGKNI